MGKAAIPLMMIGGTGAAIAGGMMGNGDRNQALRNFGIGAALGGLGSKALGAGSAGKGAASGGAVPLQGATGVMGETGAGGLSGLLPDYAALGGGTAMPGASIGTSLMGGAQNVPSWINASKISPWKLLQISQMMGGGQQGQPQMGQTSPMQMPRQRVQPMLKLDMSQGEPSYAELLRKIQQQRMMGGM